MSTKIGWVKNPDGTPGVTWNPVTGCTPISPGCQNCYAKTMARRLQAMGVKGYENGFAVTVHPDRLEQPLRWRKPRRVFVCSMGDLFHKNVPDEFIDRVFATMGLCPQHQFQCLTKRPELMAAYHARNDGDTHPAETVASDALYMFAMPSSHSSGPRLPLDNLFGTAGWEWESNDYDGPELEMVNGFTPPADWGFPFPNVWLGTTVESQDHVDRIKPLLAVKGPGKRFISVEPMLGRVDISQYIGYNPTHKNQEPRTGRVRSRKVGPPENRLQRRGLETCRAEGQPLEQTADDAPRSETESRAQPGAVPPSQAYDNGASNVLPCPSVGVVSLQRGNSTGSSDQPQKRQEERQQAGESRTGHAFRQHQACVSDGPQEPIRADKSQCEADERASRSGSGDICGGRNKPSQTGNAVRRDVSSNFKNREGPESKGTTRSDCGLYETETISWCIVGVESIGGRVGRLPNDSAEEWMLCAQELVDDCRHANVPVFVKQIPGKDGKVCKDVTKFPVGLRRREYPASD